MRIKNLGYIASISILIIGGGVLGFLEIRKKPEFPQHVGQHHNSARDSDAGVSIPKSAFLILLAVGSIGALCVRRKKNPKIGTAQQEKSQTISEDRDKAFIELNKQYLNLQYKITQHKFSGDSPPEGLIEEITNIERKVRLISRALE